MKKRTAIVAAALALAAAGCNEPCKGENVDVVQSTVPASCNVAPSAAVTVSFDVCVRCNNSTPTCRIDASQAGSIQLDPIAETCDSSSSCPLPSCGVGGADLRRLACNFTSPASGSVNLVIYDVGQASTITVPLSVTGSSTTCG